MNINRNIITSILLFAGLCSSCKKIEIETYSQTCRIDFQSKATEEIVFRDTTYLKNIYELESTIPVSIVGYEQEKSRLFSLTIIPDTEVSKQAAVKVSNPYTFSANSYISNPLIIVKRPEEFDLPYTTYIGFEKFNDATHQFEKGRIEYMQKKVSVVFRINPGSWDNQILGLYSNGKYRFIMDVMKKTYNDIERNDETRTLLYNAYKDYLLTNDSIMDDNKPPRGIVFPKF